MDVPLHREGFSTYTGFLKRVSSGAFSVLGEMLSPTRCILCDQPGLDLCPSCYRKLPFIDHWQCCPKCGQEYGAYLCCDCLSEKIINMSFDPSLIDRTYAALELNELSRRIILGFKEQGQQSLVAVMAYIMAQCLNEEDRELIDLVTYIPDSKQALRKRGFDHGKLLGRAVAREIGKPCVQTLKPPKSSDQRKLNLLLRAENMRHAIQPIPNLELSNCAVLLVDDVCTTQASLYAAASVLKENGARVVQGLCFARTS